MTVQYLHAVHPAGITGRRRRSYRPHTFCASGHPHGYSADSSTMIKVICEDTQGRLKGYNSGQFVPGPM